MWEAFGVGAGKLVLWLKLVVQVHSAMTLNCVSDNSGISNLNM